MRSRKETALLQDGVSFRGAPAPRVTTAGLLTRRAEAFKLDISVPVPPSFRRRKLPADSDQWLFVCMNGTSICTFVDHRSVTPHSLRDFSCNYFFSKSEVILYYVALPLV